MSLYRATYQRRDGTVRGLTFASWSDQQAAEVAEAWSLRDRLLTLKVLRPLVLQFRLA